MYRDCTRYTGARCILIAFSGGKVDHSATTFCSNIHYRVILSETSAARMTESCIIDTSLRHLENGISEEVKTLEVGGRTHQMWLP